MIVILRYMLRGMKMIKNIKITSKYDNLILNATIYEHKDPKAIIHILHGMCEHHKRYDKFCKFLLTNGFSVIASDHRGHGKSIKHQSDLGYFYKQAHISIIEDVACVNNYIKKHYPTLPIYIISHSMGTLITKCYLKKYDNTIDGCILLGSPSKQNLAPLVLLGCKLYTKFRGDRYRSSSLEKLIFGKFNIKYIRKHPRYGWLSNDSKSIRNFLNDENCCFTFTLNGFNMLFTLAILTYSKKGWLMQNKKLPMHFMSGEEDSCLINENKFRHSITYLENLGYSNVTYKIYKNMRHELLHESKKHRIYNDILNRLNTFMSYEAKLKKLKVNTFIIK